MAIWEGATWPDGVVASKKLQEIRVQARLRNIRHQARAAAHNQAVCFDLSSVTFDEIARYDEPCFPLPVRAFSAVGFDSRKGQPLDVQGKQDLRDTASCAHAAGVQDRAALCRRSAHRRHTISRLGLPCSRSAYLPRYPEPIRRHRTDETAWHGAGVRDCTHVYKGSPLSGLIAVSCYDFRARLGLRRLRVGHGHEGIWPGCSAAYHGAGEAPSAPTKLRVDALLWIGL